MHITKNLKYWVTGVGVFSPEHERLHMGSHGLIEGFEEIMEGPLFPAPSGSVIKDDCYLQVLHMHFIQKEGQTS